MPFKSKAQAKHMFKNNPKMAKEWASKTPDIKSLPEHVSKPKVSKSKVPAPKAKELSFKQRAKNVAKEKGYYKFKKA